MCRFKFQLRKLTPLLMLVLISAILAACAGGASPAGGGGGGGGAAASGGQAADAADDGPGGTLTIYTSMKESLMGDIVRAFHDTHPYIRVEHYSAGAGRLMARIAAERESGEIQADMLWTSEVPDFYRLAEEGILHQFRPSAADEILNPLENTNDFFTPARLGALGVVYNTNWITNPPTEWSDLLTEEFYGGFAIANPSLSGTAYVSIAMLNSIFGYQFFHDLRANGAMVGGGSGQVVDDTAIGEFSAALGVDYIVFDVIDLGATLGMAWPREMLVIPSPVAIFNYSPNITNAEVFLEFLLGPIAQQIIADSGTTPVRPGMYMHERFNLPPVEELVERGIQIDFVEMMGMREDLINDFLEIMQAS